MSDFNLDEWDVTDGQPLYVANPKDQAADYYRRLGLEVVTHDWIKEGSAYLIDPSALQPAWESPARRVDPGNDPYAFDKTTTQWRMEWRMQFVSRPYRPAGPMRGFVAPWQIDNTMLSDLFDPEGAW